MKNHDYLNDIINFWLDDSTCYNYLDEISQKLPRVFLLNPNILDVTLDKYFKSCKEDINDNSIIDKNYYIKVFNTLYNSPYYKHDMDIYLKEKVSKFRHLINTSKISKNKKIEILESISRLFRDSKNELVKPLRITEDKEIINLLVKREIIDEEKPLIKNNAFSIINKGYNQAGYAYSIIKNKDSYVLNYHVVDTPKIIIDDLNVNESLRCDNKLNTSISQILSFKKNKISPCVTISLNIGRNGEVKSFCVFKSNVLLKDIYSCDMICQENSDYKKLSKKISDFYKLDEPIKDMQDVSKVFNHILYETLGRDIYNSNYTFMYRCHNYPSSKDLNYQISNLNYYLFKVPYNDYKIIYDILCKSVNNKAYYSTENKGHYAEKERYKLDILKPFTFVGMKSLEEVCDIYIKNMNSLEVLDKYNNVFKRFCKTYNEDNKLVRKRTE